MSILRFRIFQFVMAICMAVALINGSRPDGFLDKAVWPVAYGVAALMNLALAVSSRRIYLHAWAAIVISISLIRALLFGINPTIPALRASTIAANIFLASLAYIVWGGWKDKLDGDGHAVIVVPVDAVLKPLDENDEQIRLKQRIEDITAEMETVTPDQSPTPDSVLEYRLPRVPGLN